MATILVLEPLPELRVLLGRQLRRVGHMPVYGDSLPDAVIVEPANPVMLRRAVELRDARPELPVICTSRDPDPHVADALQPCTFLVKPFAVERLRDALAAELDPG